MSNRTLVITIIIIIVVAVAGVFVYRAGSQRRAEETPPVSDQTQTNFQDQSQTQASSTPEQQASSTPADQQAAALGCTRDFSTDKLKNNVGLNIKNRQVQINVKDFGTITVELYDQDAPKTVENFLRLTDAGYYDCVTFHRVSKGFVIQGGDPTGTGSGGDSAYGSEFADELNPDATSYKTGYVKGVLAMANRGTNTNTSQFFILLGDHPELPKNYTIFGKVIAGQDVVDKIGAVDIIPNPYLGENDGAPKTPVVMRSVKIIK